MESKYFWTAQILLWTAMVLDMAIGSEKASKYFNCAKFFFLGGMVMHLILI